MYYKTDRILNSRRGFTLVELLMVVIIISILAGLSVVMMEAATKSAKESKTQSTIGKLDAAIQQIFEGYEEKLIEALSQAENDVPSGIANRDGVVKKVALHFIRDRMRMELPSHWADVYSSSNKPAKLGPIGETFSSHNLQVREPPVLQYYYQTYQKVSANGKVPNRSALLFLIIQNLNPDALDAFHGSEIGDTDGDGLPEFLDAWGHPIQFLRLAPGFSGSDKQPNVIPNTVLAASESQKETEWTAWLTVNRVTESQKYSDPFDEDNITDSWFLYPLIYSAGADGIYGIAAKKVDVNTDEPVSPEVSQDANSKSQGILDQFEYPYGMPISEGSSSAKHFDNIHNHRMNGGF